MPSDISDSPPGRSADDLSSADAAEQAAAEAEARAEAARARADELRRKLEVARAESTPADPSVEAEEVEAEAPQQSVDSHEPDAAVVTLDADAIPAPQRGRRLPKLTTVASIVGVLASAAALTGTGFMVWQHNKTVQLNTRTAEYSAAARQGVVNLMSMDYNAAKESVQRVIDDSTGRFQENLEESADDLIKSMQDSKVVTTVTVNDTAVETMTDNDAVVLVAATSQRHDSLAPNADSQPRVWRVVVTVARDGGQIKVSDVEFV